MSAFLRHPCEQFIYLFTFNTSVSFRKQNLAEGYMENSIMNKMKMTRRISFWCPKKDYHYAGKSVEVFWVKTFLIVTIVLLAISLNK